MAKGTVYRFRLYDVLTDEMMISRRMGTREGIKRIGGEVMEDTAYEANTSDLSAEITGLTDRNFRPPTPGLMRMG